MIRRSALGVVLCILAAYLALAVPLPAVLLEHELGLFTGDPAHTVHDDHAWLDHAAGSGLSEAAHLPGPPGYFESFPGSLPGVMPESRSTARLTVFPVHHHVGLHTRSMRMLRRFGLSQFTMGIR